MVFDINSDTLLSIDDICQKLSISRSTLDRWRGIGNRTLPVSYLDRFNGMNDIRNFPEPTVTFGNSPRWSAKVINEWLKTIGNN
jgi:predicted DNA-binding transcriptional regulator AlpA